MRMWLLLTGLLLTACGPLVETSAYQTQAEVEAFIGAPLPASATELQFESGGFTDTFVRLRFDAPAADVEAFLAALAMRLDETASPVAPSSGAPAWWDLRADADYRYDRHENYQANRFYTVYVNDDDPAAWRVYLWANSQ